MSKRLLGIGVLMSLAVLFVVACGDDDTSTPRPTTAVPTAVATTAPDEPTAVPSAKPEGDLVLMINDMKGVSVAGQPARAAPRLRGPMQWVMDTPLQAPIDGPGALLPRLAESWEVSSDGCCLTVKLKKGIQFHDGWGEVTAQDLIFAAESAAADGSRHGRKGEFRGLQNTEIIDSHTIKWTAADARVLFLLSSLHTYVGLQVPSKNYYDTVGEEEADKHWIGSGPWEFIEAREGEFAKFQAVDEHHWKVPEFKNLTLLEIPEPSAQLAAIRAGEADGGLLPADLAGEAKVQGLSVLQVAGGKFGKITFGGLYLPDRSQPDQNCGDVWNKSCGEYNPDLPWVGDTADPNGDENARKVREALTIAIDRDIIRETIYEGVSQPLVIDGLFPGGIADDGSLQPYEYNPTRAKALLAEAGFPDGFEVDMHFTRTTQAEDQAALAVAPMWEAIGVKVNLIAGFETRPQVVERVFAKDKNEVILSFGNASYAETIFWARQASWREDSIVGGEHPILEQLLIDTATSFDAAERLENSKELHQWWYDNNWDVPLLLLSNLMVSSDKIAEWPYPFGDRYLGYASFIKRAQ